MICRSPRASRTVRSRRRSRSTRSGGAAEGVSVPEGVVHVVRDEGSQPSLAAATLQRLGRPRATDLEGGFQAWRAAGLPVEANS